MRILMVHNYYQYRGGEDISTEQEVQLLREHGHEVCLYSRHNDEIKLFPFARMLLLLFESTWSMRTYRELKKVIHEFKPDLVHVQNFFPLISPSAFYACSATNTPVVFTLRNYRLLCPAATLFRNESICEECLHYSIWRGIWHACYRNNISMTIAVGSSIKIHRLLNTWHKKVDIFIVLSKFSQTKFIKAGLPVSKIIVRPNYLEADPGIGLDQREYAVFIGRLSPEKGLKILIEAWQQFPHLPLKIIGDGPLLPWLEEQIHIRRMKKVELVGFSSNIEVFDYLKHALFLVMPSLCYETFGRTILESYATATPVLASHSLALANVVEEKKTGLVFNSNDVSDLVAKIQYALNKPDELRLLGQAGRYFYEQNYSPSDAYQSLINIYQHTLNKKTQIAEGKSKNSV